MYYAPTNDADMELWLEAHNIFKTEDPMRYFIVTYRWRPLKWLAACRLFPRVAAIVGVSKIRYLRPMHAKVGKVYSTLLRGVMFADRTDALFMRLHYYDDLYQLKMRLGGGHVIHNAEEELEGGNENQADEYGAQAGAVHKARKSR